MSKIPQQKISFFKCLLNDDFNSQLRIPPQFVQNHAAILRSKATIRIQSGESWIVRIEKIGQHHFFTDGWSRFSQDVNLEFGDFLLFLFDGAPGFIVSIFGTTGCEKELTLGSSSSEEQNAGIPRGVGHDSSLESSGDEEMTDQNTDEESEDEEMTDQKSVSRAGKTWRFRMELTKKNECQLELPKRFALQSGIANCRKIYLRVQGRREKWPIYVTARKNGSFAITSGWNQFLIDRKVRVGSKISIEFVSNRANVIVVKILKTGKNGLFSVKKGKGRPSNFCKK